MNITPYELYQFVQTKGYIPPMAGQVTLDSMTQGVQDKLGVTTPKFVGTGEHLKEIMEIDRLNVFKSFYGAEGETESTWLAGEEPGRGMILPTWAERLIHADVLVMQEKVETTMDYLLHVLSKQKAEQK